MRSRPLLPLTVYLCLCYIHARTALPRRIGATLLSAWLLTASPAPSLSADMQPGVTNELLRLCPDTWAVGGCVASQDDRPRYFLPPWAYDGDWRRVKESLLTYVSLRLKPAQLEEEERYLRFLFRDPDSGRVDDCEFYFTVNDNTIQYRSAREGSGISDFNRNRDRIESIRLGLGLENIEVLRSRGRALKFLESPLDSFGPSTNGFYQR